MSSSKFLFSIVTFTLALALSGCGSKPDASAEAAKQENPSAAQEAATAQSPGAAPAAAAPSDANNDVNTALSAVDSKDAAGGVVATQNLQQATGATAQPPTVLDQAKEAMNANSNERAAVRAQMQNRRLKGNNAE